MCASLCDDHKWTSALCDVIYVNAKAAAIDLLADFSFKPVRFDPLHFIIEYFSLGFGPQQHTQQHTHKEIINSQNGHEA